MSVLTTKDTPVGWSPDVISHLPSDVVPQALIERCATQTGSVEGDATYARCTFVRDSGDVGTGAVITAEGDQIAEETPDLAELDVKTRAITRMVTVSQDQYLQSNTASALANSFAKDLVRKADSIFLNASDSPLIGLRKLDGVTVADSPITSDLGPLTRLLAKLERNGATPSAIICDPESWAQIRDLRVANGYNQTLLGSAGDGTDDRLLGLPVYRSPFVEIGEALVIDRSEIVSASSQIEIAVSDQHAFDRRGITLRAWWRIGFGVPRPERIGRITVTLPKSGK